MLKRILSVIISLSILLPTLASAAPAYEGKWTYYEMFDQYKTNAVPKSVIFEGSETGRVVADGNRNKAFFIETGYRDNNIQIPLGKVDSQYVVGFDVKITGKKFPADISLSNADGTLKQKLMSCSATSELKTTDGKIVGGFGNNRYVRVEVKVDCKNGFLSILLDGKTRIAYWPLTAKISGDISLLMTTASVGQMSAIYIDNVSVNTGTEILPKKKQGGYNNGTADYLEVDESVVSERVYLVADFEDKENPMLGINPIAKTNKIETITEKGNTFARITKETKDDVYLQMQIPETSPNVVWEMDLRVTEPGAEGALFWASDGVTDTQAVTTNFFSFNEMVARSCARNVLTMKAKQWYNVAVALNLSRDTLDLYVDGKKLIDDGSFTTKKFRVLSALRVILSNKTGNIEVDNIKIYDGKEPREIGDVEIERELIFQSEDMPRKFLNNKRAIQPYTGYKFVSGEKEDLATDAVINGEKIYISKTDAKDFLPDVSDFSDIEAIKSDKEEMYLLSDLIEKSKRYVFDDNYGVFISAESEIEAKENVIKEAKLYMSFERPTPEQLKEDFFKKNGKAGDTHPRVFVNADDFARLRKEVVENDVKKEWFRMLKEKTDALMNEPGTVWERADGLRILTEANQVKERIWNLGFCYQMTGDKKYADRAWKEVEAVFAFPDWNARSHFLDTGELSVAFAVAYDWFYDIFTDEQKKQIYEETQKYGLKPHTDGCYGQLGGDSSWVKNSTNWNVVGHGGAIVAALAMAENDPDYCMSVVSNAMRGVESMWYEFGPDGGWHEGPKYWGYVMRFSTYMMTTMLETMGTDYNLTAFKGMSRFPYFVPAMLGPQGLYNFHDSVETVSTMPEMFWYANYFNEPGVGALRLYYMQNDDVLSLGDNGSYVDVTVRDLLWYDTSISSETIEMDKDVLYQKSQLMVMRSSYNDPDALFLGFHGAETKGGHNHYDAGSFVLDLGGVRWGSDLGTENNCYYDDYKNRVLYYKVRAESHNLMVINPDESGGQDEDGFATIDKYEISDKSAYAIMDLSSDYKTSTDKYNRGFMLSDSRRSLTVRDEVELKGESDIYWFFTTTAEIEIVDNNTVILTKGNKQLKIQFVTDADSYEITAMKSVPLETSPDPGKNSPLGNYQKVAVKIKDKGKLNFEAKFSMLNEPTSAVAPMNVPLEKWKLTDGLDDLRPAEDIRADMLYLDGKPISDYTLKPYNGNQYEYEVTLFNAPGVPKVTTKCESGRFEVVNSQYNDGTPYSLVKIYDKNGYYETYMIEYKMLKSSDMEFGQYTRHVVYASSYSSMPEALNRDVNTYDGKLDTRWSADGDGEWLVLDMGSVQRVDAIGIAFMNGSKRSTKYDILVSSDGVNYTQVISTSSSGKTDDYEITDLKSSVNARYIKFVGHGNTVNTWNSVTELAPLKRK